MCFLLSDASAYITRRLFATAPDGERAPISVLYRRETPLDGTAPLLVYGYGAYGHVIDASFSTNRLSDVHILADALAAHAPDALEVDGLALIASVTPRSLELSVGPLSPAEGERLLGATEIPSLGWVIERLTDGHSMSPGDGPGMLVLELRDRT